MLVKPTLAAALALTAVPTAQADQGAMIQAALNSGSERMAIYALSDPRLPLPVRVQAGQLSNARGYGVGTDIRKVSSSVDILPVLTYDSDINGGVSKDGFNLSGFDFVIPEDERRKSGVVLGAAMDASVRYALGRQTVADISGWVSHVWSPKHDITKTSAGMSACVTKQMERDLYLSGCAAYALFQTDLKDDQSLMGEVKVNRLFGGDSAIHDVGLGVSRVGVKDRSTGDGYAQTRVTLSGTTLFVSGDFAGYGATFGEKVDGEKVRTLGLTASYGRTFGKQTVIGNVGYDKYDGTRWLGQEVREEAFTAGVRVVRDRGPDVSVRYVKTSSGSALNDGNSVFFDVNYNF